MLILVGVTINVALNGGLFTKASEASKLMQLEADRETLLSSVVAAIGYDGKVDLEDIKLPTGWTGSDGTYTSPKGNTFAVDENGKIEEKNTIEDDKKYYTYTVKELSGAGLGTLLGEYSGQCDELMYIVKEEIIQILLVRRTSENFITFQILDSIETFPTLVYFYDFINNKWYDINEEELSEVPNITFSNAKRLSAEEIVELTGQIEEQDYVGFTQEQFDAMFTVTSAE